MKTIIQLFALVTALATLSWPVSSHGAEPQQIEAQVKDAKSVAEDTRRTPDERREAIFSLGKAANAGSQGALTFLVANISLRVPMGKIKGDEDELKETPCKYALGILCRDNRHVPAAVLAALDREKSQAELGHLAFVLERTLGQKRARATVNQELSQAVSVAKTTRQRNLEIIRKRLAE